jgi:integrase
MPLDAVTAKQIEEWLATSDWAPRTQRGYLMDVRTLYAFCKRRGICTSNPALAAECPELAHKTPGIHSPGEVSIVLETAREADLNVCRCLAVRYFAGLRASEAERIEERQIRREDPVIEVGADISKTRKRRLVTIQPALGAWLDLGGELPLRDVSNRMRALVKTVEAKGVLWPQNAPRHSFCSYHLAMWQKAGETALEAGHSEQMLFQHYRALVSKKEAESFWAIRPK